MIQMSNACRRLAASIGRQAYRIADIDFDDVEKEVSVVREAIKAEVAQKKAAAAELLAIIAIETGWFVAEIEAGVVGMGHEVCEPLYRHDLPPAKPEVAKAESRATKPPQASGRPIRQFTEADIVTATFNLYT